MATANAQADKALTYAAVNTTIATTTAIALQKAGYQTQTISTPNGLITTIKDPNANTTQQSASDDNNWQQVQEDAYQQRQDFMSN